MCVVSMVIDYNKDKWTNPYSYPTIPPAFANTSGTSTISSFDLINALTARLNSQEYLIKEMRKEFEDMKALLKRAKIYDDVNNEPDCEVDEKVDLMIKIANLIGVDPGEVLTESKKRADAALKV